MAANHSYHRTVIVTAGVHRRLASRLSPRGLTFRHWPGVSSYTYSCEFAGTCVFGKQSPGVVCCTPPCGGESLSRTYGHCFAEFLNEGSPDHLGAHTPTHLCWFAVRTASQDNARRFSGKQLHPQRLGLAPALSRDTSPLNEQPDLPSCSDYGAAQGKSYTLAGCVTSSRRANWLTGAGISTCCPSPTHLCLGLGPANPGLIDIAQETLGIRRHGFSPCNSLLMPPFSLPHAPPYLTVQLRRISLALRRTVRNAPLPPRLAAGSVPSVTTLSPVEFSAQSHSTSELLRFL